MPEEAETQAGLHPAAPPTSPRGLKVRAKAWPTVIGVVCLLYAALGLLGGVVGLSTPMWEGAMRAATPGSAATKAAWDEFSTLNVVIGALAIPMSGLAGAGAVQVLRRRVVGRTLLRTWAVLSQPLAVLSGVAMYNFELQQIRGQMAVQTAGTPMPSGLPEMISGMMGVIAWAWGAAWPLFVLFWFARASVREDCRGWARGWV